MFVPKKSSPASRVNSPFAGLQDRDIFDLLSFYPRTSNFNTMLGSTGVPVFTGYSADDVYRYIVSSPTDKVALSLITNSIVSCVGGKSTNFAFTSLFYSLFNELMGVESETLKIVLGELSGTIYPALVYEELVRVSGGMYYKKMLEVTGTMFPLLMVCDELCPLSIKKKAITRLSLTLRTRDVKRAKYEYNYAPNTMRNTHVVTCVALSDCLDMYRDVERCNRAFKSLVTFIIREGAFIDIADFVHVLLAYLLDQSMKQDNTIFIEYIMQIRRTMMYIEYFFGVDIDILVKERASHLEGAAIRKCATMLFTEDV